MKTFSSCRLIFLLLCVLLQLAVLPRAFGLTARVDDVVSSKVISVAVSDGELAVDKEYKLMRDGKEVARIKVRTETGICKVLSGEAKVGDQLAELEADTPIDTVEIVETEKRDYSLNWTNQLSDVTHKLLQAEGLLDTYIRIVEGLPEDRRNTQENALEEARAEILRIYPAALTYQTTSDVERVSIALREATFFELADKLCSEPVSSNKWFGTLYPKEAKSLSGFIPDHYGAVNVITPEASSWMMPSLWGRSPQSPQFSGWTIVDNTIWITNGVMPLARKDIKMDDAILRGEVNLMSGDAIYIALRSDIVVKFHVPDRRKNGSVSYKVGYNNLRFSSATESIKNVESETWLPFSIRLEREELEVTLNDEKVLAAVITQDERFKGKGLASFGHVTLGSIRGSGGFRGLELEGLSPRTRRGFPRFKETREFKPAGPVLDMLKDETRFSSLFHSMQEKYKAKQHSVEDGVLSIRGAAYSQFSLKDSESDFFKASGKIRFNEPGSAWFRAHAKLMFGAVVADDDQEGDDVKPVRMKMSTGNFHQADEIFEGTKLRTGKWYDWSLEFHDPAAVFTINGKTYKASGPADRDPEKTGPTQFGVSSYNTDVDLKDISLQKLEPLTPTISDMKVTVLHKKAQGLISTALAMLDKEGGYGAGVASKILKGEREPRLALDEEFDEAAKVFREDGDWTTYLALLEANMRRLDGDAATNAEKMFKRAREKYQVALEMTDTGEVGLDRILRTGDEPGLLVAGPNGTGVFIKETSELMWFEPGEKEPSKTITLEFDADGLLDRGDWLIGAFNDDDEASKLAKIDPATGKILKELEIEKGYLTDIEAHPHLPVTFVCINENPDENTVEFTAFKVYVLNEQEMTLTQTDAVGMLVRVDPYGRFLYTAFQMVLTREMNVDPGFLQVIPAPVVDHLVSYSLDGTTPELLSEQPAPGMAGEMMAVDPEGRYLCYVPAAGFTKDRMSRRRDTGVPAYRSGEVGELRGSFDSGKAPQSLAFNPAWPDVYIYNGLDVRRFNRDSFDVEGAISLPAHMKRAKVERMLTSPDGRDLLIAFEKDDLKGVYIHPLYDLSAVPPGGGPRLADPVDTIIAEARAADKEEGKAALSAAFVPRAFSADGDKIATALLEMDGLPFSKDIDSFDVPDSQPEELDADVTVKDIELDGTRAKVLAPSIENEALVSAAADLDSFATQAEQWPSSMLWRCRIADKAHTNAPAIRYRVAQQLLRMSQTEAARNLAGSILEQTNREGFYAFKTWLLLADLYQADNKPLRSLTALDQAARLYPGNPVLHNRLAETYSDIGMPRRSTWHMLQSWSLFPSQRGLAAKLSERGLNLDAPLKELTTTELFQATSPSIVLIKHESGSGTGYIVGNGGLLLTNWHVIDGAEKDPIVRFHAVDGEKEHDLPAKVLATDSRKDIALLAIELGDTKVNPLLLGDSDKLKTGDPIVAIGNPGFGASVLTQTATEGIVSNADRKLGMQSYIQISAAVNPGNSGGPLLNSYGQVVGMVTLKAQLENVGFAVPANELVEFIMQQHQ